MSIKIKLVDDQILVIHADPDAWAKAYQRALDTNTVIKVHDTDGRTLAVNPHQILFWEESPDAPGETPAPDLHQAQPA